MIGDWVVIQEDVRYKGVNYFVSTVHLRGLTQWETMVFVKGDWSDLYCRRYKSKESAAIGHENTKADLLNGVLL